MIKDNQKFNESIIPNSALMAELRQKLPEFFTAAKYDENGKLVESSKFDNDKFQQALQKQNVNELSSGYRLDFIGKNYAKKQAGEKSETVIVPDVEHNEKPENKNSNNLFFTGDNLEVLRHLQQNYANSVNFIYIDPPYNTGSDGFVYPDKFEYSDDQLQDMFGLNDDELKRMKSIQSKSTHSAWLAFMYPRLYLAKKLLKDSGVVFVSIDDNEQANLKLLMDDVFGESSFINQFNWIVNLTGRQISGFGAAKTTEFILSYAKNSKKIPVFETSIKTAKEKMPDAYKGFSKKVKKDSIGEFTIGDTLWNHNRIFNEETRPNLVFSIFYNPKTGEIIPETIGKKTGFVEISPHKNSDGVHKYHAWRWSINKVKDESHNLIVLTTSKGYEIHTKIRNFSKTTLKDLITNISNGDSEVSKYFDNKKVFDFPKPTDLIKILIKTIPNKKLRVLDFFAGSATTADAVMQLNAEDDGERQYMMVQLSEPTKKESTAYKSGYKTIDQISRARIEKAAAKMQAENPLLAQTQDLGFKHYRFVKPNQQTLDKIEYNGDMQLNMFDDMISQFSSEKLGVKGNASGFDTILQTYLVADNYKFDVPVKIVDFAGIKVPYVNDQRVYIIANDWGSDNTKALVNAIGTNKMTIQTVVVFGYPVSMEHLRELEIALNQLENKVNLLVRY